MGSLSKLLGMLPGMGELREQVNSIDERELDRVSAIIQSMTPGERREPKLLNGSRRSRIARGSGTQVSDVNSLIERFTEARKMMKQVAGGMPGMPGMPGLPGMGGPRGKKARGKASAPARKAKAGRSGNPAKRAQEARLEAERRSTAAEPAAPDLPPDFELPAELRSLLPPGQR